MKYNKQPLDIPALLAMLKARGLTIGDEQHCSLTKLLCSPCPHLEPQLPCDTRPAQTVAKELLLKYPIVDPAAMGFVKNWQDEPLWK